MVAQKIHILGEEEMVSMLGLLGLEGTVVENEEDFLKQFIKLTKKSSIGMIIIVFRLSPEVIEFLLDFKQSNRFPFIFILPDIFQPNIEKEDIILNKIISAIGNIISI
ncbi:MAG: V-type ATP synthase subunit F [Candidatus Lokiarchaeota archaeon]|nr:V-type ATP synthase subunit F [Candidatus Lokiarchaeota archaeon]